MSDGAGAEASGPGGGDGGPEWLLPGGFVAWETTQPAEVRSEASLVAVAQLVRQFHDFTAQSKLVGDEEVACHNDLSPKNTVYRDLGQGLRPVAFIDWDIAAPGARIHDVAHVCWQYLGLGPGVAEAARRCAAGTSARRRLWVGRPDHARRDDSVVAGPMLARD